MTKAGEEFFIWTIFQKLVRRNFAIGLDEYGAVMRALRAGFGWTSRDELRQILCSLWATSREESVLVGTLFDQCVVFDWNANAAVPNPHTGAEGAPIETPIPELGTSALSPTNEQPLPLEEPSRSAPVVAPSQRLPPLKPEELPRLPYSHVFLPQYPVSYRDVAQTWRRLRSPLREGPATELDVGATIARRSRLGVGSPPVLRPRRRNQADLLILVDRRGSMAPFYGYVDEVCSAIAQAGRLGRMRMFFFHDTPLEGSDLAVLDRLDPRSSSNLDSVLGEIPALTHGILFRDPDLIDIHPAEVLLKESSVDTAVVVISDAGAARGRFDPVRLLDTVASLKGFRAVTRRVVWLNPLPESEWTGSTARQIARHVPMFAMDRGGMHRAINVLRGQPVLLERPLPTTTPSSEFAAAGTMS
ncbi:VWA domain-containing protein [Mesorhizobium sp. M1060]|uniref:VWA domain-containing protein n=1 Tax=unclassified Mesorhizobium TaxID=325217 RepID=UPI00257914BE|nr:VWA domain-containing protein [Mesorhizobium sp. C089B]WJI52352.1 VWA domain-containing protein [Mesorhizobium sp. C089B]